MKILGLPILAWLIIGLFLAFCAFVILRGIYRIYMSLRRAIVPMEPTEETVKYIISRYGSSVPYSGPYMVYIDSNLADSIGFNGVVDSFKRQFGNVFRWQNSSEDPDQWPTHINRFNGRRYKEIILEMRAIVR
jgi:hypothetical protein